MLAISSSTIRLSSRALPAEPRSRNACAKEHSGAEAQAVLIGLDSYAFVPDPEAIATANKKLVETALAAGIDALARSGFGRKSEAISITLQTSAFHVLLQQLYTRGSGNSVVFGELRTIDSRECQPGSSHPHRVVQRFQSEADEPDLTIEFHQKEKQEAAWLHIRYRFRPFTTTARIWRERQCASKSSGIAWAIPKRSTAHR
jgi:hypothetical protein